MSRPSLQIPHTVGRAAEALGLTIKPIWVGAHTPEPLVLKLQVSLKGEPLGHLEWQRDGNAVTSAKPRLVVCPKGAGKHILTTSAEEALKRLLAIAADRALRSYRVEEAEACLRILTAAYPNDLSAMMALILTLRAQRRYADADELARRCAPRIPPYDPDAACYGLILMERGEWREAWAELRQRLPYIIYLLPPLAGTRWDGDTSVDGRTVLIRSYDGHGDAFQYVRFASTLADHGARVTFAARRAGMGVLATAPGVSQVIDRYCIDAASYDLWVNDTELPALIAPPLDAVPHPGGYLKASPDKVQWWRDRLPPGRRIGLCWAGVSANLRKDFREPRSTELDVLKPLLAVPNTTAVSLQIGDRAHEVKRLPGLLDVSEHIHDFTDTAALIEALDLTISVETSVAHLAGALGQPVWIILGAYCPPRWLRDRTDSPWYASARLFRQPILGDWRGVIAEVTEALTGKAAIKIVPRTSRRPSVRDPKDLPPVTFEQNEPT